VTYPLLVLVLLALAGVIGIVAGIYPAMILSGFKPVQVLKSMKLIPGSGISWTRQALVVLQFSLSILLIICSLIVFRQTNFLNNTDLGFNRNEVVYFQLRDSLASNPQRLETFKTTLRNLPGVASVTSGYGLPGDLFAGDGIIIPSSSGEKEYPANVFIGDEDYIKTLGLRIVAGRDFSKEMTTDATAAFIINETAAKEWGYGTPEKAIGKPLYWPEWSPADSLHTVKKGKITGVVEDFHYKSLHEKVTASVIQIYPAVTYTAAVKLKAAGIKNTIASIGQVWNRFSPGYPLDYKFMDETYGNMYHSEEKLGDLLWIFTIMAIFIGCMGLFGLAAFNTQLRTKEIGIRKVLGASVLSVINLLAKNFLLLVVISSVIAFPVAWWTMSSWLNNFPYRVAMSWWIFVTAIAAALFIAFATVSIQSYKASTANPVKSLRSE
jgi:putative ABC transport system permease protein